MLASMAKIAQYIFNTAKEATWTARQAPTTGGIGWEDGKDNLPMFNRITATYRSKYAMEAVNHEGSNHVIGTQSDNIKDAASKKRLYRMNGGSRDTNGFVTN